MYTYICSNKIRNMFYLIYTVTFNIIWNSQHWINLAKSKIKVKTTQSENNQWYIISDNDHNVRCCLGYFFEGHASSKVGEKFLQYFLHMFCSLTLFPPGNWNLESPDLIFLYMDFLYETYFELYFLSDIKKSSVIKVTSSNCWFNLVLGIF